MKTTLNTTKKWVALEKALDVAEKNRAEAAADAEHDVAVAEWWKAEGEAMWRFRTVIPGGFMGEEVNVIRYTRYQEQYMPFVAIKNGKDWLGEYEIEATVSGLTGRDWKNDGGVRINPYSSSSHRGKTIQDVLYSITH